MMKKASGANFNFAVKKVVGTFLEEEDYRKLFRILSEQWGTCHSLTAAVQLMQAHGVPVSEDDEKMLSGLSEEEMIDKLVMRMPQQTREQFEHFFLQLSLIASTTTRLRSSIESGRAQEVQEVLDSAEDVGILTYILKMAVAQAGQEVKHKEIVHDSWVSEAEGKIGPLLTSQANSMAAQKQLSIARASLAEKRDEAATRAHSVLSITIWLQHIALVSLVFGVWREETSKNVAATNVSAQYEEALAVIDGQVEAHETQQKACVRGLVERKNAEDGRNLLIAAFAAFVEEFNEERQKQHILARVQDLQKQVKVVGDHVTTKAKTVLEKLILSSIETRKWTFFNWWVQHFSDSKRDAAAEAAITEAEEQVHNFLKGHNECACRVLGRLSKYMDDGLINYAFHAWFRGVDREKKDGVMMEHAERHKAAMKAVTHKTRLNAKSGMRRRARSENEGALLVCLHFWKRETRLERMKWYGKYINNRRQEQLVNVKQLFSNFADELEDGLRSGTPRIEPQKGRRGASSRRGVEDGREAPSDGRGAPQLRDGRDERQGRRERDRDRNRHTSPPARA